MVSDLRGDIQDISFLKLEDSAILLNGFFSELVYIMINRVYPFINVSKIHSILSYIEQVELLEVTMYIYLLISTYLFVLV